MIAISKTKKSSPTIVLQFLKQLEIFSFLNETTLLKLTEQIIIEKYKKHYFIYRDGDTADKIFFVIKGTIKIWKSPENNKEVIKSIIHPKTMFGEQCLFNQKTRVDFAEVVEEETIVFSISKAQLLNLMGSNPLLSIKMIELVGRKLLNAERRYEALCVHDARKRVIDFLKYNATKHGKMVGTEMLIKHSLTQQDIANFTGTSRQTVTSILNDLKKTNQIYLKRKTILIRDISSLN